VALSDEIKDALSFLKDIQTQAKGHKAEIEKVASEVQRVADILKGLSNGDPAPLQVTLTQFENVNRLLLASASAEQELVRKSSIDWEKVGDGIAKVAGVAVKIGLAIAI
jgi:hypothetical protein